MKVAKYMQWAVDGFQMHSMAVVANEQSRGSCTANLSPREKQLFYLSALMVRTQCSACILHTTTLNADPSGSKATPHENHLENIFEDTKAHIFNTHISEMH